MFGRGFENGLAELVHPVVLGGAGAGRAVEQLVFFQQLREERARLVLTAIVRPGLGAHAIAHRLAQERVRVVAADEIEQVPGAIGQHDAVDFGVVLHGVEEVVERVVGGELGERGEGPLGFGHVFAVDGFAEEFGAGAAFAERGRFDGVKDFFVAPAFFLDSVGISVKDLEDRQRLERLGQLARHVERRRQRHHGVEADVILAAESTHVGQGRGRDQVLEVGSLLPALSEDGQQFAGRRFLEQFDHRLQFAEGEFVGTFFGLERAETHIQGQVCSNASRQHALADVGQKLTT